MLAISLTVACSRYTYDGVILGESHNQRNTTGEVATVSFCQHHFYYRQRHISSCSFMYLCSLLLPCTLKSTAYGSENVTYNNIFCEIMRKRYTTKQRYKSASSSYTLRSKSLELKLNRNVSHRLRMKLGTVATTDNNLVRIVTFGVLSCVMLSADPRPVQTNKWASSFYLYFRNTRRQTSPKHLALNHE